MGVVVFKIRAVRALQSRSRGYGHSSSVIDDGSVWLEMVRVEEGNCQIVSLVVVSRHRLPPNAQQLHIVLVNGENVVESR